MERLQKILSEAGLASRRAAEEMIREGRVTVGGKVAALGDQADPDKDDIRLDGQPVRVVRKKSVFLFHKPKGVVTTLKDPEGRPCLADFLKDRPERLYPVGRLDFDASGLLILTNDGDLAQRLAHPSFEAGKTYLVQVRGWASEKSLRRLTHSLVLDERPTEPAQIQIISRRPEGSRFLLTIHEGRNHQVKRMCRRVGLIVEELKRIQVGPFLLGRLAPGEMREATPDELAALRRPEERQG